MRVAEHTWALVPGLLARLLVAEVAGAREGEGEGGCGLVGLRSTLGESVALRGEVGLAPACGAGGGVALRAGLGGSRLALEHSWLGGHRTRVAVDGRLQLPALPPLGVGLLAEEERLGRGLPGRLHLTQRLTLATGAFHLTHHLHWMVRRPPRRTGLLTPPPGDGAPAPSGNLRLLHRLGRGTLLRTQLSYALGSGLQPHLLSVELDQSRGKRLAVGAGLQYRPGLAPSSYSLRLAWRADPAPWWAALVASAGGGGLTVALTLATLPGLRGPAGAGGPLDGLADRVPAGPPPAAGSAAVRVFLDRDSDGQPGPGEPPVSGVALTVDGRDQKVRTDTAGFVRVDGLPAGPPGGDPGGGGFPG